MPAKLKHSVMVGLMGRQADRFHEYQPAHDLTERLEMAGSVRGIEGSGNLPERALIPSDMGCHGDLFRA